MIRVEAVWQNSRPRLTSTRIDCCPQRSTQLDWRGLSGEHGSRAGRRRAALRQRPDLCGTVLTSPAQTMFRSVLLGAVVLVLTCFVVCEADVDAGADSAQNEASAGHGPAPDFTKMRVKQLRLILDERGVECKGCAEKSHLVERCEEVWDMPTKVAQDTPKSQESAGDKAPEMSKDEIDRLMAQMRGDFSHEKDPEKRRILDRLKKKGISFGGESGMNIEQLRTMEKAMSGMANGKRDKGEEL